jgi:hypothetical protein
MLRSVSLSFSDVFSLSVIPSLHGQTFLQEKGRTGDIAQFSVTEHLPSMHEALGSVLTTAKRDRERERELK